MSLKIKKVVDRPIVIHLATEMGAGKSTFIKLLRAYETWLQDNRGLEDQLIFPFIEDTPHGNIWEEYQKVITGDEPSELVFKVQSWFLNQKLGLIYQAAGLDYPGTPGFFSLTLNNKSDRGDFGIKSNFFNYDYQPGAARSPGIYIVERLAISDMLVFAARYERLFLPGGSDVPGSYANYVSFFKPYVDSAPTPDLYLRLKSSPEVSLRRVLNRGTGELLMLEDYEEMQARYYLNVNPFIKNSGRPCISIDTTLPELDYTSPDGQQYFLMRFFRELYEQGLWLRERIEVPFEPLLKD